MGKECYNGGMGVRVVGRYLQLMIERRNLKALAVTAQAGVAENYVWRLAAGEIKAPSAAIIARLVRAVQGDAALIIRLLLDEHDVSEEALKTYIDDWIHNAHPDPLVEDARRRQARASLEDIISHPDKLDRLLGYADRLREEDGNTL